MDDPRTSNAPLPPGYRQGVISAITVVISFSLLFMRYWGFEASGRVTRASAVAGLLLLAAILLEFYTLWRSLQLADDSPVRIQDHAALVHGVGRRPAGEHHPGLACGRGDTCGVKSSSWAEARDDPALVRLVLLARAARPVLSASRAPFSIEERTGGVAERSKAHAWKVCIRETVSRVRIPPPPPRVKQLIYNYI